MKTLIVTEKYNNKKLSSFFANSFNDVPISVFYKLLRKKDIKINGNRIHDDILLHTGDEVVFYIVDHPKDIDIQIVYEDDNILVINKPSSISVTNENGSLTEALKKKYKFIEPCHRIDRNTTGLVVFAKNSTALEIMLSCFRNHQIEKHYVCLVSGKMQKKSDVLNSYLFKDSKKSLSYISDISRKGYLSITTSYEVVKYNKEKDISLLDVEIKTGRTHQIRAHMAYIGHPILGDGKYGINEINKKYKLKTQALCAYCLKFKLDNLSKLHYLNSINIKIPYPEYFNIID